jgi:predicted SAM-dependent methyltransferase
LAKPAKLHLGAGPNIIKGWKNYDIEPYPDGIFCDLRNPLPHKDNTVDMIFSEHVIEHFTKTQGEALLRECYRVLKPGGAMRIGWPGLELLLKAYIIRSKKYRNHVLPHLGHEFNGWDEILSDCLFSWEHRYAYTTNHLARLLKSIGFQNVQKKSFGKSDYAFKYDIRNDPATSYLESIK